MTRTTLVLFGLTLCVSANAAIIDHGAYTTDTATGLDWLDVTASQGRSYDDVAAQLGAGGDFEGWQFATTEQFITLLVNATGLATTEIANPYGYVLSNSDLTHDIVTLMGDTCADPTCTDPYDIRYTYGWLALPADGHQGAGNGEVAIIFDYHDYINGIGTDPRTLFGYGPDYPGDGRHSPTGTTNPGLGSFLVRTSVVPVPAAAWLFGSGLIGLIGMSRTRNRKSSSR